jgi:hypothetical protein
MARPNVTSNPAVPTQKSPVPGYTGESCGSSFHFSLEVRKPYLGRDDYSKILEPIIEELDIGNSADLAVGLLENRNHFEDLLTEAYADLEQYSTAGKIDSANAAAIETILSRASKYFHEAAALNVHYEETHLDTSKPLPWGAWSLDEPSFFPELCDGKQGEVVGAFACPTQAASEQHESDKAILPRLVGAAVRNLRCAQEAIHTVAIYNMNKAKAGMGSVSADIPVRRTRQRHRRPLGGRLDNLGGDADGEAPEIEPAPPEEKKEGGGNGLLLLGAAAVALLVLRK